MKKTLIYFVFLNVLIISAISFGQTYSGPSTGSIDGGVVVTTDNFLSMPIGSQPPSHQSIRKDIQNPDMDPIFYNGDKEFPNNYVYVEDEAAHLQVGEEIGINFELYSFPANTMTNFDPPDPAMAVGPNHVVTSVNMNFAIWDREGNLLKNIDGVQWFSQVAPSAEVFGDPQVIYDHFQNRWFFLFMGINDGAQQASNLICYSDDENPLGTWYMYRLDTKKHGTVNSSTWGDYPHVGYDDQAIYITTNCFNFSGGFAYSKIRILNKSELYNAQGGALTWTDIWNISLPGVSTRPISIQPAISYMQGNNTGYFGWNNSGTASIYVIYKIADPITNPILSGVNVPATNYSAPPNANQLGGITDIANLSRMTSVPVLRDGKLYATHSIRNTQFSSYGSLRYWVADVNTNQVIEEVELGAQGYFYLFPSIAVDQDNNIAITYSRSADTEYVGAYYSTRLSNDPPGLSQSKVMAEGQGNYNRFSGNSVQRWGDYLQAGLDPSNQYNFWFFSEYAADVNTWRTWLTEIRMVPFQGAYAHTLTPDMDFGNIEVNFTSNTITAILANYGGQDLVISDIPSSMGDFSLDNAPTFPLTLSTYDSLSLDFTFSPTVAGDVEETFLVSSNDPNFEGFTLMAHGYSIYPALDKVMYASSGPQNDGNILSLNTGTGEGTNIGPSSFIDILGLAISPLNNELLAVKSIPSESQILRVNSLGGDTYLLYSLDLGGIASIAFDNSGTLYGALESGDIYSIDLTDGTYQYISTAQIELVTIAFEPMTNDLWATIKAGFGEPKDGIYKIDLPTGDTTTVGETGFNVATNALAFDENGVLYGIKGSGPQVSDLFTIDVNTGEGTLVGSVGLQALTGLAFAETGVVNDVQEDENNNTVPTDFALSQNYPNPFNPNTSINFSVPVNSDVTLRIYNLLGQVVTTLVNEEVSAGHYSTVWNGSDDNGFQVSSGVYLYEMKANGNNGKAYSQIKKMVFLK